MGCSLEVEIEETGPTSSLARAVVYDAKQDIFSILSGMGVAVPIRLLNPLDTRGVAWNVAADINRAGESISLSSWLSSESVLVLGNDEQIRVAMDTINRLLFRRLAELVLARPEVNDREKIPPRTWFFLDEIREAYGQEVADEILGQCNTKVILRLNSPKTAACAAKLFGMFGKREILETRHGRSINRQGPLHSESSSGESVSHAIAQQP